MTENYFVQLHSINVNDLQKQKNKDLTSGKDDKKLEEEALQKLKLSNGDTSVLTSEEKQALDGKIPVVSQELSSSSVNLIA